MKKNQSYRTETGEDFALWRAQAKERRDKNSALLTPQILEWATSNDVSHDQYTPYVIRLTKGQLILDIYPMTGKWHNVTLNKRGQSKDVISFLENTFYILNQK